MKRLERKKEYLYYTCAFLICVAILAIPFLTHQRTFIHGGDTTFQFYPVFLYTGRYLQGLLRGEFHLYDFSIGYGEDVIGALNYHGFGDPLNLFSIFVTNSNAAFLFSFLIFVRLYLAGIGMISFFHYREESGALVIGGALVYVFSVFSIGQGVRFYSFLNPMYLLPFLLVQLEKLMRKDRKRKDWIWFAFLIAVQSCCSFYFLFFQTFFLGIYWLVVCLEQRRESLFRTRIKDFFRYIASSYLVGIFLSAPILFPALDAFFHSARTSGGKEPWSFFFSKEMLLNFERNFCIPYLETDCYSLGLPILSVAAIFLCFSKAYRGKREQILVGFSLLMYLCPTFWRIMNGFSYAVDRWIYFLYFTIAYSTVTMLHKCQEENGFWTRIFFTAAGCCCLVSVALHWKAYEDGLRCMIYAVCVLAVTVYLLKKKKKELILCFLLLINIILNLVSLSMSCNVAEKKLYEMFAEHGVLQEIFASENAETKEWRRRDDCFGNPNGGMVKGYNGTSLYLSIANGHIADFYRKFYISPGIITSVWNLWGLDNRQPLKLILGADAEYPMQIGLYYEKAISEEAFEKLSAAERQGAILDYVIVDAFEDNIMDESGENVLSEKNWPSLTQLSVQMEYQNVNDGVLTEGSSITLQVDPDQLQGEGELYVYLKGLKCWQYHYGMVTVDGKEIYVCNDENSRFYREDEEFLVKIDRDETLRTGKIEVQFFLAIPYALEDIQIYWNNCADQEKIADRFADCSLQNVEYSSDLITGELSATRLGWLFLSIPYNKNWTVYVDGEKIETVRANIGFTAVPIVEGEHDITLKYRPAWFWVGMGCFAVALSGCVALLLKRNECA